MTATDQAWQTQEQFDTSDAEPGIDAPVRRHPVALSHDATYPDYVDGLFIAEVARLGYTHLKGYAWATDALKIDLGDLVAVAEYEYNRTRVTLTRLPHAVAFIAHRDQRVVVRVAAHTDTHLESAHALVLEKAPVSEPGDQTVAVGFWSAAPNGGGRAASRKLLMPSWAEIAGNYAPAVRAQLAAMMDATPGNHDGGDGLPGFVPGRGGRLLLWDGEPGTGKTHALRALAWEWRDWCTVHYITDPEVLFGSAGPYLMEVLAAGATKPDQWRLIVLEDSGELLSADAKSRAGQGLSRMLNVVDGLLGQSFSTLLLITTNEDIRRLHPAVSRPGRCGQHIEFAALDEVDADAWLAGHKVTESADGQRTLAELYAVKHGLPTTNSHRRPLGF